MRCARAGSRVRSKSRRKGTRRYMLTNNNNSDSGYFAYSNNRMPFLVSLSLQVSRRGAELEARARMLRPEADASRFAWQVTRNLFACQRTHLSPLIPPPKLLRASKRFTYPSFTWSCFWCYHYRPALQPDDLPKRIAPAIVILPLSRISMAWY